MKVHVGFVVGKVTLGQVFVQVIRFPPLNIISPWIFMLMYHLGGQEQHKFKAE
jgi:hypothetical protein